MIDDWEREPEWRHLAILASIPRWSPLKDHPEGATWVLTTELAEDFAYGNTDAVRRSLDRIETYYGVALVRKHPRGQIAHNGRAVSVRQDCWQKALAACWDWGERANEESE